MGMLLDTPQGLKPSTMNRLATRYTLVHTSSKESTLQSLPLDLLRRREDRADRTLAIDFLSWRLRFGALGTVGAVTAQFLDEAPCASLHTAKELHVSVKVLEQQVAWPT